MACLRGYDSPGLPLHFSLLAPPPHRGAADFHQPRVLWRQARIIEGDIGSPAKAPFYYTVMTITRDMVIPCWPSSFPGSEMPVLRNDTERPPARVENRCVESWALPLSYHLQVTLLAGPFDFHGAAANNRGGNPDYWQCSYGQLVLQCELLKNLDY